MRPSSSSLRHFSPNSELEVLAAERVRQTCSREEADAGGVVAVTGLASLFDFMRVSSLIERVEDSVSCPDCIIATRGYDFRE